jgi:hypothetical protein
MLKDQDTRVCITTFKTRRLGHVDREHTPSYQERLSGALLLLLLPLSFFVLVVDDVNLL